MTRKRVNNKKSKLLSCQYTDEKGTLSNDAVAYERHIVGVNEGDTGEITEVPKNGIRSTDDIPLSPYIVNTQYNTFTPFTREELVDCVEYEADPLDRIWLKKNGSPMDEPLFCQVMDSLEKESTFKKCFLPANTISSPPDLCAICEKDVVDEKNNIVYCDMCNIAVHQDCYGIPMVDPDESKKWFCSHCIRSPSTLAKCALCPLMGGAFKPDSLNQQWVHSVCAMWNNDVSILCPIYGEPIGRINEAIECRKWMRACFICREKVGSCVQCKHCRRAFHATCGLAAGFHSELQTTTNKKTKEEITEVVVYCSKHDPLLQDDGSSHKRETRSLKMARNRLEQGKIDNISVGLPFIEQSKIDSIGARLGVENMRLLVDYWYCKRMVDNGVPLLHRLKADLSWCFPKEENRREEKENRRMKEKKGREMKEKRRVVKREEEWEDMEEVIGKMKEEVKEEDVNEFNQYHGQYHRQMGESEENSERQREERGESMEVNGKLEDKEEKVIIVKEEVDYDGETTLEQHTLYTDDDDICCGVQSTIDYLCAHVCTFSSFQTDDNGYSEKFSDSDCPMKQFGLEKISKEEKITVVERVDVPLARSEGVDLEEYTTRTEHSLTTCRWKYVHEIVQKWRKPFVEETMEIKPSPIPSDTVVVVPAVSHTSPIPSVVSGVPGRRRVQTFPLERLEVVGIEKRSAIDTLSPIVKRKRRKLE